MVDFKPEIKKVIFRCTYCSNPLLIVHNMMLPVYFSVTVKCPLCESVLNGDSIEVVRSAPNAELMKRIDDPDTLV